MSDEWGPWIEHDGRGWPPAPMGTMVERVFCSEFLGMPDLIVRSSGELTECERGSWVGDADVLQVKRYRLLADQPETVDA